MKALPPTVRRLYRDCGPRCQLLDRNIETLQDFLDTVEPHGASFEPCWFRGHSDLRWTLTPSALRYRRLIQRERALELFRDFRQRVDGVMPPVKGVADQIEWMQRAQHYGLPTRLLDWSQNAARALYFACQNLSVDGLVFIINPFTLNRKQLPHHPRPVRPEDSPGIVEPYATLGPGIDNNGLGTVAISPIWSTDRIRAQQGVFTLHGNRKFCLDTNQAPSLLYVPIRKRHKRRLMKSLEATSINEMTLFPEPEKVGRYLRQCAQL